ncbi:MAG: putative 4-hydroxybenzoate polyprenyltransferase [Planctomycetota bacterium]
MASIRDYASLVRFSHSVFALPFALLALLVATGGRPSARLLLLAVLAVIAARTSAMAYNRYADRDVDARNPRTRGREIPRGAVSARSALWLSIGSGAVFLAACALLSPLCLAFGVPVWLWLLGYSHCKRFSSLSHLWLGTALGLSPVGAWLAADGAMSSRLLAPLALGAGVACWVAGFDILYACQDLSFDREAGLYSVPRRFGPARSFAIARGLHGSAVLLFALFGAICSLGSIFLGSVALAALALVWEHRLLSPDDLSRMQHAFFTANAIVSLAVLAGGGLALYVG